MVRRAIAQKRVDGHWSAGDVIVLRGVSRTKIWYALPTFVVQDTPELIAIYWPAGTSTRLRMKSTKERFSPQDVIQAPMNLIEHTWVRTDVLMLIPPGAAHAIYVMWDTSLKNHLCWYCNLQDPIERTPLGFDTCDHWLDVVFKPDRSGWRWKDEDELDGAVAAGIVSIEKAAAIRAEGERVIRLFEENKPPFCDGWEKWSPPAEWRIPDLPEGWDMGFNNLLGNDLDG